MKKLQALFDAKKIKHELITFPGYVGILFGYITLVGVVFFGIFRSLGFGDEPLSQPYVGTVNGVNSSNELSVFATTLIGVAVAILLVGAIWVYVSKWTKRVIAWLAKKFKVHSKSYWSFCTILLLVGWIAMAAVAYVYATDYVLAAAAFVSACFILFGSASFGLASLKKMAPHHDALQVKNKNLTKSRAKQ